MKLDRRKFLQGLGASTVLGSLSGLAPGIANAKSVGANGSLLNKMDGEVKYHSCLRNCADRCLLKFRVQDGRMTYVTGAEEHPPTGTSPCAKGHTYVQYTYAPDRILHPMERAGKKGEGKWRRISWDEAYEKITSKLKGIIEEHGAEAILPYSYSGNYGAIGMKTAGYRFFNRLGASKLDRLVCAEAAYFGFNSVVGGFSGPDPEQIAHTDCYLSWGFDENVSNVHAVKLIHQCRDNGGKLLVVNPLRTSLASQADVFLQPRPTTDAWVAVGVMKYLVEQGLVAKEYIAKHTMGYDQLVTFLKGISFEEIERVTGVPTQKLFEFARIYGESKTSIMRFGYGAQRNFNGARIARAAAMMHAIGGHFGQFNDGFIYDNMEPIVGMNRKKAGAFHLRKDSHVQHINMTEIAKALDGENPMSYGKPTKKIHAVINYNGNMVSVAPDSNAVIKSLKRDDLFVVGHDFVMTDTLDYCDIIVPAATQFETTDIIGSYTSYYVQVCEKVIEPLGESKCNWTFFRELGQKMGFEEPEFQATNEDIIDELLDTDEPYFAHVTKEKLYKEKFLKVTAPQPPYGDYKFPTESGKLELYSEYMKEHGYHPIVDLGLPEDEMEPRERDLPFRLLSPGIPERANSGFYNVKYIRNIPAYYVKINPADAKVYGIEHNDTVRLSNHRGEATFTAVVTDQIVQGTVLAPKCNWRRMDPLKKEGCTNNLTTDKLTDMGGCSAYHSTRVRIEKV